MLRPHPSKKMSGLGGVNGTVCNAQQYQQSLLTDTYPTISCLTRGQSIGLAVSILICREVDSKGQMMSHAVVDRGIVRQSRCRNRCPFVDSGMSNFRQCLSTLTRAVQRNVLRYRKALPNGDWKLLRGSADIYMVCSMISQPRAQSHFILLTVFPFCVRYCAGHRGYPRCSMGPQRDRQCGPLLHSTRHHSANRRTRGRTDYSRASPSLTVPVVGFSGH